MKRLAPVCISLILAFSVTTADAQFKKLVSKALKGEKMEIKSKKDSTTIVEINDGSSSNNAKISDEAVMKAFGLTDNVEFENEYKFDAYIKMSATQFDKKGEPGDQEVYDTYLRKRQPDYAMVFYDDDGNQTSMIFDASNATMLMLSDAGDDKSGFATSFDPERFAEDYMDEDEDDVYFKSEKTGKSKEILGYTCEEYFIEDEQYEVSLWVSEKLGKQFESDFTSNEQFAATLAYRRGIQGIVMEYDQVTKKNGELFVMMMEDMDLNMSHAISTKQYPIISLKKKDKDTEE